MSDKVPEKRVSPVDKFEGKAFKEMVEKIFSEVYSEDDPELPLLPEKYRNFAFRWATEFRTTQQWADVFHVSPLTIAEWKRNPKILKYYFIIRRKHNLLTMERMKMIEDRAFQKLNEVFDLPVSDKNIESMGKLIMRVLGVDVDGVLNLRLTAEAKSASASSDGKSAAAVSAKAEVSIDLRQLRDRIDEWELMERIVGPEKKEEGHEPEAGPEETGEGKKGD